LKTWARLVPDAMDVVGSIRVNNRLVLLREAELILHKNVPGSRDGMQAEPRLLEMTQGIVVHKSGDPLAPRLPVLGVRALVRNKLRLFVDGPGMTFTLEAD
jgi:hypothetical protein